MIEPMLFAAASRPMPEARVCGVVVSAMWADVAGEVPDITSACAMRVPMIRAYSRVPLTIPYIPSPNTSPNTSVPML